MFIDMHVHCFELEDVSRYVSEIKLVCVSDDPTSSLTTLNLSEKYKEIEPCIGVHPWIAHEHSLHTIRDLLESTIKKENVKCLGEIGLDKRFKPETFEKQLEVLLMFIKYAKEHDLVLNIHAADAWREVLEILRTHDISRAYFHWYTGPIDVLEEIQNLGYFVGVNPAWMIQSKHRMILELADLNHVITESDAPYSYRGLKMTPDMVKDTVRYIASVKKLNIDYVKEVIYRNYLDLFKSFL